MNKIYTGNDKAREMGFESYRDLIIALAKRNNHEWSGKYSKSFVYARVDFGRWIADCECGGASYVSPDDPDFFFCATCGNAEAKHAARKIIFPNDLEEIEKELLERNVKERLGTFGTDAALNSTGKLSRSWYPGETVETLKEQRRKIEDHGI